MTDKEHKKITIFYFSGTGNTWWAAKEFSKIAEAHGDSADIYSIEKKESWDENFIKERLVSSDAIGFAYPIYGSTMPNNLWDFLDRLIEIRNSESSLPEKRGFVFTTMSMGSGDGALVAGKKLKKAGIDLRNAINLIIDSNCAVPRFPLNPVSEEKHKQRLTEAAEKLNGFYNELFGRKKHLEGSSIFSRIPGALQRLIVKAGGDEWLLSISIDKDRCTKCGICLKNCPTVNFKWAESKDLIETTDSCVYCLRCYNFCPSNAIMVGKRYANPDKYNRYHGPTKGFKLKDMQQ